jgi:hypothetical protein
MFFGYIGIQCNGCGKIKKAGSKSISVTDKFFLGLALCDKCKKEYRRRLLKAFQTGKTTLD